MMAQVEVLAVEVMSSGGPLDILKFGRISRFSR